MQLIKTTPQTDTRSFTARYWPYLLLGGVFLTVFIVLVILGLDLGFVGDVLTFEYFYERLGVRDGMRWLTVGLWQRHLLGSLYSASIHTLFPDQSGAWYGATIALHFVNAILGFWLADMLLRGTRRWLAVAAALLFAFHTLQINDYFEFPTGGLRHTSFALALLSLGLYLRYVRGFRRSRWQRELGTQIFR